MKKLFSAVEMVIVAAIISILCSIIMSSNRSIRAESQRIDCLNNLKGIQSVVEVYRKDYRALPEKDWVWLDEYTDNLELMKCKSDNSANAISYELVDTPTIAASVWDTNGFHEGKKNVVWLHTKNTSKAGIAQTVTAAEWFSLFNSDDSTGSDVGDTVSGSNDGDTGKSTGNGNGNGKDDGKVQDNNGHGNNVDGVDSSNKGKSKQDQDSDPTVDDEKKK